MEDWVRSFLEDPQGLVKPDGPKPDDYQVYGEGAFEISDDERPEIIFGRQVRHWLIEEPDLCISKCIKLMEMIFDPFRELGPESEIVGQFLAEVVRGIFEAGLRMQGASELVWDIDTDDPSIIGSNEICPKAWYGFVCDHHEFWSQKERLEYSSDKCSAKYFIQVFCLAVMTIAVCLDPADSSMVFMNCLGALSKVCPAGQLRSVRILCRASALGIRSMTTNRAPLVVSTMMAFVSLIQRAAPRRCEDSSTHLVYLDLQLQNIALFNRVLGNEAILKPQPTDIHNITLNTIYSALIAIIAPFAHVIKLIQTEEGKSSKIWADSEDDSPVTHARDDSTIADSSEKLPDHHEDPEITKCRHSGRDPLRNISEALRFRKADLDLEDVQCIDGEKFFKAFEHSLDLLCRAQPSSSLLELSRNLNMVVSMTDTVSVLEPTPLQIADAIAVTFSYWRYRNSTACMPMCMAASPSTIFVSLMRSSYLILKRALCHEDEEDKDGLICSGLTFSRFASQYTDVIEGKYFQSIHSFNIPLAAWMALQVAGSAAAQPIMGVENVTLKLVYGRCVRLLTQYTKPLAAKICESALSYTLSEITLRFRDLPTALWIRQIRTFHPIWSATAPVMQIGNLLDNLLTSSDILLPWAAAIQEIALTLRLWSVPAPSPLIGEKIDALDRLRGPLRREMAVHNHQALELADFAIEDLLQSRPKRSTVSIDD